MTTDQIAGAVALERISRGQLIRRRFFRNKTAVFGLGVIAFMFLFAFGGPFIGQWSYTENDFSSLLQGPSASHWFGTTQIGVDVFAQTTRGLQKSLIIGLLVAVFSTGLSAIVGRSRNLARAPHQNFVFQVAWLELLLTKSNRVP